MSRVKSSRYGIPLKLSRFTVIQVKAERPGVTSEKHSAKVLKHITVHLGLLGPGGGTQPPKPGRRKTTRTRSHSSTEWREK